MPAQAKVTSDQVLAAAAGLRAGGERVTGCSLRRILGHGRPDRLMAIVEEHGASLAPASPAPPQLPPAMSDLMAALEQRLTAEVRAMAADAWQRASELAARRMEADLAETRSSLAAIRVECADLNEALALADVEQERRVREIADLRDEVRISREQLLAIRGTLAEVRDREREARDELLAARRESDRASAIVNGVREACASVVVLPELMTGAGSAIDDRSEHGKPAEHPLEGASRRPQHRPKRKATPANGKFPPTGESTTLFRMHPQAEVRVARPA